MRDRFLREYRRVAKIVTSNPSLGAPYAKGTRRYIFNTFPYNLITVSLRIRSLGLAIAHHSREESYWHERQPE